MKKILIATTALVATASVAAAEVTFGGYGRFGVVHAESAVAGAEETFVEQRFRLTIRGTAVSDAGVEFSGRIRIETNDAANGSIPAGNGAGAAEFSVESGGLKLFLGNTSDLLDSGDVVPWFSPIGLTDALFYAGQFADAGHIGGFNAGGDNEPTIKIAYNAGDFTVGASYENDRTGLVDVTEWQIGAAYDFGVAKVGFVYGNIDNGTTEDFWALGAKGDIGQLSYNLTIYDSEAQDVGVGASVYYDVSSATTIQFHVADGGSTAAATDDVAFGIGVNHSLGGGVSIRGHVGQNTAGLTRADLGVRFNF